MENSATHSSYWGKLKPRKRVSDELVRITIGTHSFCVSRNDPYLAVLHARKCKGKVFVVVAEGAHVPDPDDGTKVATILEVQITDSYSRVSRYREFWEKEFTENTPQQGKLFT